MNKISPVMENAFSRSGMKRIMPEPKSRVNFGAIVDSLRDIANQATHSAWGINGDYQSLINQQLEAQRQMMMVSMVSNTEKSRHETRMTPIRNIKIA
ncbi:MAG: hypothetical protein ACOX2O_00105 [Bdellovibrionota bacterium]|jgi:hypothetical protein